MRLRYVVCAKIIRSPLSRSHRCTFYVVIGRNAWEEDHFERFLGRAKIVYRDREYDRMLQFTQQRVPIYDYNEDLRRIGT
jgi:hypothetical protein